MVTNHHEMATDHDLIVETNTLVKGLHKALYGNGRPGLIQDVAILQDDMRRREAEADELRAAVPGKKTTALVNGGAVTLIIGIIAGVIKMVFEI